MVFLNFLRGMETEVRLSVLRHEALFLNFLRGMETDAKTMLDACAAFFLNFLRGMETTAPPPWPSPPQSLPKLP